MKEFGFDENVMTTFKSNNLIPFGSGITILSPPKKENGSWFIKCITTNNTIEELCTNKVELSYNKFVVLQCLKAGNKDFTIHTVPSNILETESLRIEKDIIQTLQNL